MTAASPYSPRLASASPASNESTTRTAATGPNVSWVITGASPGGPTRTVGG